MSPNMDQESEEFGPWITEDFGKKIIVESHICAVQTVNRFEDRIYEDALLDELCD